MWHYFVRMAGGKLSALVISHPASRPACGAPQTVEVTAPHLEWAWEYLGRKSRGPGWCEQDGLRNLWVWATEKNLPPKNSVEAA